MSYVFLTTNAAVEYLKSPNGMGIEQWISHRQLNGFRLIYWIRIVQEKQLAPGKWTVIEKNSLDVGSATYIDVDEFEDVGDPDKPEGERHFCESPQHALALAESLGAAGDRYVVVGGIQYIYREFFIQNGPPEKGASEWFVKD